jgi:uncharacterized protein
MPTVHDQQSSRRALHDVIHLPPLPGSPFHDSGSWPGAIDEAVRACEILEAGGADGALLQTVDRVYSVGDDADPARIAAVTACAVAVKAAVGPGFELGIQVMRHAISASLAIAKVVGGSFVRADAIVGETLSTHGRVQPDPLQIMTYRRAIEAFDVRLIADIDSMHFRWPDAHESTGGVARRAALVGADGVCIADRDEVSLLAKVADVRSTAPDVPVWIGGFVDHDNVERLVADVHGAFVSTCLVDPNDRGRFDVARVRDLADAMHDGC